jgi:hypothetical protein
MRDRGIMNLVFRNPGEGRRILRRHVVIACILIPGLFPAAAQQEDVGVHSWFARQYGSILLKDDAIGTSAYRIQPRLPLARPGGLRREVFGYLPYWFRSRWSQVDYALVSTVAYFSGEVGADGSVGNTHGWPKYVGDPAASSDVINFISAAHGAGVRVVLCFTNFDAAQIRALVSSPVSTTRFLQEALTIVQAGSGDGVNINFESIPSISRDSLTLFMRALADSFHTRIPGAQVSCAPTDYDTRQGDWDLPALQSFVDLFFFQGYGYHYSGSSSSGPIGLLPNSTFWGSTNITTLVNLVLSRIPVDKVLLGLPHFGYRWPTATSEAKSATTGDGVAFYYPEALSYVANYGRRWDEAGLSPWYTYQAGTQWYQGWYDDPESMAHKYQFALDRNLMGVGMWALGQDGANHDIWDVLALYFADSATALPAPRQPVLRFVGDSLSGSSHDLLVRWSPGTEGHLGGYRLFVFTSAGGGETPRLDESVLQKGDSVAVVPGLSEDSLYFVRMVALDTSGTRYSDSSDTYTVRPGGSQRYLVVDGFDRVSGSWTSPRHDFVASIAGPLAAEGRGVDVADNDALALGEVALWEPALGEVARGEVMAGKYDGLFWLLGDESVADRTFAPAEQSIVQEYLAAGGRLFVTGSEVGYDLDRSASPNYAPAFYEGFLKATYAGDKASSNSFAGSGALAGISGTCGAVYPEDYPDYILPSAGAVACATYAGGQIAGVQYSGPFGGGSSEGRLVYLAFTFETIGDTAVRNTIIRKVVDFFEGPSAISTGEASPRAFQFSQNYPNPFNPVTQIGYTVGGGASSQPVEVTIAVYDLLGREVARIVQEKRAPGVYTARFDATGLSSGVYFCRMTAGRFVGIRKMVFAK